MSRARCDKVPSRGELQKTMIEQLHERRLEILGFLARRAGTRAGPPSVREIAEAVGKLKTVDPNGDLVRMARAIGVCFGD